MQLVLVNPIGEVIEKLQKGEEAKELLGRGDCMFLTVGEAVAYLLPTIKTHQYSSNSYNV